MDADIRPEPSDAEREAILAALREDEDRESPYTSAWRRVALDEARGADGEGRPG